MNTKYIIMFIALVILTSTFVSAKEQQGVLTTISQTQSYGYDHGQTVIILPIERQAGMAVPLVTNGPVDISQTSYYNRSGNATIATLGSDGKYDIALDAGTYFIAMPNGNGGQPEYIIASVISGQQTSITFKGNPVVSVISDSEIQKYIEMISPGIAKSPAPKAIPSATNPDPVVLRHVGNYSYVPGFGYNYVGDNNGDYIKEYYGPAKKNFQFVYVEPETVTYKIVDL